MFNARVNDYWTPAHHAVEHEDAEALARLLAGGSDPDEVYLNMTLLTHAIDAEGDGALQSGQPLTVHTTAVLLAFGADPELADPDGRTPLEIAGRYGHDLAVQLLRTHIGKRARAAADEQVSRE
ncbi:ankyrin repeat domain-containing protein [Streptomyces sp. NPDC001594]|uniref:ankyrin repeat domain-containing protein n=1 Tax=Streptomyces sp. NPDC001594 TaxID=3364590 RepID=UPI0036A741A0